MSTPILQASGLTMRFGGVVALSNVDFSIAEVELRCLIGPNGAGKSTFFKCLTGVYKPTAGTVQFRGRSTAGLGGPQIARLGVGIKTQVPNVFDGLDVRENIRLAAARVLPPQTARKRVDEMLQRLNIGTIAAAQVGRLAHGHRQLVELAMVMAPDPDLVLLDEPAAGMNPTETIGLSVLLQGLRGGGLSILLVEHDMAFVMGLSDQVTVLNFGRVIADGRPAAIRHDALVIEAYLGHKVAARLAAEAGS